MEQASQGPPVLSIRWPFSLARRPKCLVVAAGHAKPQVVSCVRCQEVSAAERPLVEGLSTRKAVAAQSQCVSRFLTDDQRRPED